MKRQSTLAAVSIRCLAVVTVGSLALGLTAPILFSGNGALQWQTAFVERWLIASLSLFLVALPFWCLWMGLAAARRGQPLGLVLAVGVFAAALEYGGLFGFAGEVVGTPTQIQNIPARQLALSQWTPVALGALPAVLAILGWLIPQSRLGSDRTMQRRTSIVTFVTGVVVAFTLLFANLASRRVPSIPPTLLAWLPVLVAVAAVAAAATLPRRSEGGSHHA